MNKRKPYPSDLNDQEWAIAQPVIPPPKTGGRRREVDMREVLNEIFYVLKSGCQWDMLPHDFPPKGTVYHYFNTWRKDGTWAAINDQLREQLREELGREATPIAASIDSQSVKTTEKGGRAAMMAAKRSKGANAISVVDTEGLLLKAFVTEANYYDGTVGVWLLPELRRRFPRLIKL